MKRKPKLKTTAPSMYTNVVTVAKVQWHEEPGGQTDVCVHILHLGRDFKWEHYAKRRASTSKLLVNCKNFFSQTFDYKNDEIFLYRQEQKILELIKGKGTCLLLCIPPNLSHSFHSYPPPTPHGLFALPKKARVTFYLRNLVTSLPC